MSGIYPHKHLPRFYKMPSILVALAGPHSFSCLGTFLVALIPSVYPSPVVFTPGPAAQMFDLEKAGISAPFSALLGAPFTPEPFKAQTTANRHKNSSLGSSFSSQVHGLFLLIPSTWEDGRGTQLLQIHHESGFSLYFKVCVRVSLIYTLSTVAR